MFILLYVKLMQCSGILYIYGQLEEGGLGICAFYYMSCWFCVVVFQRSMITWRRGRSEFSCCSSIPQIYDHLEGAGHLRLHLIWKYENVKMTLCSTPLGHKISELGGHLIWWVQVIWKDDLILLLATRCQHQGGHLISGYTSPENFT